MARLAVWILAYACVVAECGSRGGSDETRRSLKVAFVTNNSADFWTIARRGVERADEEIGGCRSRVPLTSDGTAAEQQRIVDDLLTKGVDAIAISPVDAEPRSR